MKQDVMQLRALFKSTAVLLHCRTQSHWLQFMHTTNQENIRSCICLTYSSHSSTCKKHVKRLAYTTLISAEKCQAWYLLVSQHKVRFKMPSVFHTRSPSSGESDIKPNPLKCGWPSCSDIPWAQLWDASINHLSAYFLPRILQKCIFEFCNTPRQTDKAFAGSNVQLTKNYEMMFHVWNYHCFLFY